MFIPLSAKHDSHSKTEGMDRSVVHEENLERWVGIVPNYLFFLFKKKNILSLSNEQLQTIPQETDKWVLTVPVCVFIKMYRVYFAIKKKCFLDKQCNACFWEANIPSPKSPEKVPLSSFEEMKTNPEWVMPLCCGFTLFINNSLAKCVFFMFDVAGKTLLLKRKQKTFPLISLIMKGNVSIVKKRTSFYRNWTP